MKIKNINLIISLLFAFVALFISSCGEHTDDHSHGDPADSHTAHDEHAGHDEHAENEVHLSNLKFNSLDVKVDKLPTRTLSGTVSANGQLEVPPQHEATVTAVLGANVTSIKVIEGDKVNKGQVLAYMSHPNLVNLQTKYIKNYNRMQYLEKEYQRKKRLYEEEVGSGKEFQQVESEYFSTKGEIKGLESQLKQLNLNLSKIKEGEIYENVPVVSPINGFVEKVEVQIGQYVEPQTAMFMVVNIDHIHADFMVFEKDVHKIKVGQTVTFTVESVPGSTLQAEIYSVGKKFEKAPKALHVHAEIINKEDFLISGMYIKGRINVGSDSVKALPESAIVSEEGKSLIFVLENPDKKENEEWIFKYIEVQTGIKQNGWVEIKLMNELPDNKIVAWNNAYYLLSEMKKSETSHSH